MQLVVELEASPTRDIVGWAPPAAACAALVAAIVPPTPPGWQPYLLQVLLLVPFAVVAWVSAAQARAWRLMLGVAGALVATLAGVMLNGWLGSSFRLTVLPLVVLATIWAPWNFDESASARDWVLWSLAVAPLVALAVGAAVGDLPDLRAMLGGARLHSTGSWNELAPPLLAGVVAAHALLQRKGALLAYALGVANLLLLALTSSRFVGTLALAIGLSLGIQAWRSSDPLRHVWPWIVYGLVFLPRAVMRSMVETGSGEALIDTTGRWRIWEAVLERGGEHLLTGGGWSTSAVLLLQEPRVGVGLPHNEYLWLLVDVGVVGLVLVGGALTLVGLQRWRDLRREDRWTYGLIVVAMPLGALIDNVMQALTYVVSWSILLAAIADPRGQSSSRAQE